MRMREITEQQEWENGIRTISFRPFTQSFIWGEFQAGLGKSVKRFFIEDEGGVSAACQLIFESRPLVGGYWFAPKGPIFVTEDSKKKKKAMNLLQVYAKTHLRQGVFLRAEPMLGAKTEIPPGWERKKSLNPSSTRRLDLKQTKEVILHGMHQKTRYNIRLSEKKGAIVRAGTEEQLSDFLRLMKETAERRAFIQHADAYMKDTFEFLNRSGLARLRVAEFEDEIIAGQMEIWYGDTVTYLYGASSSKRRELMAPYALHWSALNEAEKAGMHWYDLWGENPGDETSIDYKKSWDGISRFKKGFGGEHLESIGTLDSPIRGRTYRILRLLRRI